jgi:alkylated DNA nucleotide flippase Atl1
MNLPLARFMLMQVAASLPDEQAEQAAAIAYIVGAGMYRRSPIRRSSPHSLPMSRAIRREIRSIAATDPDMPYQDIAVLVGVSAGRVSETLAGKRM